MRVHCMKVAINAGNIWFSPTGWSMDTKRMQKKHSGRAKFWSLAPSVFIFSTI